MGKTCWLVGINPCFLRVSNAFYDNIEVCRTGAISSHRNVSDALQLKPGSGVNRSEQAEGVGWLRIEEARGEIMYGHGAQQETGAEEVAERGGT
ncbi:Protein of unknown function [Gryllus bimaculatus]|nr:Protein of unknown function [Gryllus bimaculatus]